MVKKLTTLMLILAIITALPVSASAFSEEEEDAAVSEAGQAAIAACIDESMTDLEKLTALHDWMCLNVDYGLTPRAETVYGALVQGKAVCVGYAAAYAYLAGLAGLEGTYTYSVSMDHAWILATLDGERYFSDCTWDDGKYQKLGLIRHAYWLFDESNAIQTNHYGWDSAESVPGGALEAAPWHDAVSRVIFSGDWAYYIDGDFCLWRCDRGTWETEPLLRLDVRWPDTDPTDGQEPELYTGLILLDERLYFNTPYAICSVDLEGGAWETVLAPEPSDRLIYEIGRAHV